MKIESQFGRSASRKWIALLTLAMFIAMALVQVAHFHPAETGHPDCPLCLSIHFVAAATPVSTAPVIHLISDCEVPSQPQPVSRLSRPAKFIRPPPPIA